MGDDESKNQALTPASQQPPMVVNLGASTSLDLSALPEKEREALIAEWAHNRIDIARKAEELGVDVRALDETLRTLSGTAREVSESGDSVTISHTQTTSIGRTEVMIGNTRQAESGKFSRSQTGERDWTPYYVGGGLIALVLIVAALASNGG